MFGQVQEVGKSAGGKPKAKISGQWYFLPTDKDTGFGSVPEAGRTIEYEVGKPFNMGEKTFQTIDRWRVPEQGQTSAQAPPRAAPAPEKPSSYIDEASLRFISNVVGQAIATQTIKEPGQILAWFNGAKAALDGKPAPEPFDDRIPIGDEQRAASGRW